MAVVNEKMNVGAKRLGQEGPAHSPLDMLLVSRDAGHWISWLEGRWKKWERWRETGGDGERRRQKKGRNVNIEVQPPSSSLFMNTPIIFSLLWDISRNVHYFKYPSCSVLDHKMSTALYGTHRKRNRMLVKSSRCIHPFDHQPQRGCCGSVLSRRMLNKYLEKSMNKLRRSIRHLAREWGWEWGNPDIS